MPSLPPSWVSVKLHPAHEQDGAYARLVPNVWYVAEQIDGHIQVIVPFGQRIVGITEHFKIKPVR